MKLTEKIENNDVGCPSCGSSICISLRSYKLSWECFHCGEDGEIDPDHWVKFVQENMIGE